MPQYITRPGGHDTTCPGPYTATGVDLRLYVLNAQFAPLLATVDRYLNALAPAGTRYLPLGDRLIVCCAAMDSVISSNLQLGSARQIAVACFIPVVRFEHFVPRHVAFFAPYLFVDLPQAAATGREVHGCRTEIATSVSTQSIYLPTWSPNAADLTHVEAWAMATPGARLQRTRLIELTAPPTGAPFKWANAQSALADIFEELIGRFQALTTALSELFGDQPSLVDVLLKPALRTLFNTVLSPAELSLPVVGLRQFRDPRHSTQADVQELVVAKIRLPLSQLSGERLPGTYEITFHDVASHPFAVEFGIASDIPVTASLTMHARCALTLEDAT